MIMTNISCNQLPSDPAKWSDEQLNKWFSDGSWLGGWQVKPHPSINKRSLAIQYFKNKDRWDKAFAFLKNTDLNSLPKGKVELDGQNLFYTVDSYITKNPEDTRYESHKEYIDIQYVYEGAELMGITTADQAVVTEPYKPDIMFYSSDKGEYAKATPAEFLIFFPEDVHRPTVKAGDNAVVKKIVIKVRKD
jgi:YhcH/YjgK/YiaL family protein